MVMIESLTDKNLRWLLSSTKLGSIEYLTSFLENCYTKGAHLLLVLVAAGGSLDTTGLTMPSSSAGLGKSGNMVGETSSFTRGGGSAFPTGWEIGLAGFWALRDADDFLGLLLPYTPSFLNTTFSLSENSWKDNLCASKQERLSSTGNETAVASVKSTRNYNKCYNYKRINNIYAIMYIHTYATSYSVKF